MDSINEVKPLSQAEHAAISRFLNEGVDVEDVLRRSVQLLSQLTRQAAVVQLPTLKVSRVRHCEVVTISELRLLLVLITDIGRVEQRNVELGAAVSMEQAARLKEVLNQALVGKTLSDASVSLADLASNAPEDIRDAVIRSSTVLIETLVEAPSDRLILAGASNLSRMSGDLPAVLEALEEQVVVLKLLSTARDLGEVQVSIGEENEDEDLYTTSIVTTGYGATGATFGGLGVVGPTYMDYLGTMSKVSAVAHYVSRGTRWAVNHSRAVHCGDVILRTNKIKGSLFSLWLVTITAFSELTVRLRTLRLKRRTARWPASTTRM